jgi:hypothetical protein
MLFFASLQSPSQPSTGEGKTSQQDLSTASTLDISDLNHLDFSTASQPDLSVSVASTCTLDPTGISQLDRSNVSTHDHSNTSHLDRSSVSTLDSSTISQLDPSNTSHMDRSSESEAISARPFDTSRNAVSLFLYNFAESSAVPVIAIHSFSSKVFCWFRLLSKAAEMRKDFVIFFLKVSFFCQLHGQAEIQIVLSFLFGRNYFYFYSCKAAMLKINFGTVPVMLTEVQKSRHFKSVFFDLSVAVIMQA